MQKFLLFFMLLGTIESRSLLNRYFSEEDGQPIERHPLEDDRVSDADVGMKSDKYIGTFGGRPIETRQETSFIDQDGVPVPMLPYHETYRNSDNLSVYSRFMDRHGHHHSNHK